MKRSPNEGSVSLKSIEYVMNVTIITKAELFSSNYGQNGILFETLNV